MGESQEARATRGWGHDGAAPETPGVNNVLPKLAPALTLTPPYVPLSTFPICGTDFQFSFFLPNRTPVLLDTWPLIRKTTFPRVPLQPSVGM